MVVSDSSVPGEGEHKIMNYVRNQRRSSTYDPNMVHVIHGLDADLIMLVLGLHEEHFYVLREEIEFRSSDEGVFCFICSSKEHGPQRCPRCKDAAIRTHGVNF